MYAIKLNFTRPGAKLPVYTSAGSSQFAFSACLTQDAISIAPGARETLGTGMVVAIPSGWELNFSAAPGGLDTKPAKTILSHDRNEITISLVNATPNPIEIRHGDVIAMGEMTPADGSVSKPALHWAFHLVPSLPALDHKQVEVSA